MDNKILVGWAEKDFTPQKRVKLAGQFFERISEFVETPVSVTALAVEVQGEQMIICSCDLVKITAEVTKKVREKIKSITKEIDASKIIIAATHTHTSIKYIKGKGRFSKLSLEDFTGEKKTNTPETPDDVLSEEEATELIVQKISEAIVEAWSSRKKAYYANEFGRAVVGHCRRVVYDDNTAKMYGDTFSANFEELEAGSDSGIELMYFFDEDKKLTGVMVNVACPSQVVEHRRFISSDYWGKVKILLREKYGDDLYILGLCGAAGDQSPRDMVRWVNPVESIDDPNIKRDNDIKRKADTSMFEIEGTWELGRRIAGVVTDRLQEAEKAMKDTATLVHELALIDFPVRKVTLTEYNYAKNTLEEYIRNSDKKEFDFNDNAYMHVCTGIINRFEYQKDYNLYTSEIHVLRFGNIAIATNPFELFLNFGLQIKARSLAEQTFLIQLACDGASYLPTKKAEQGSHYSAYVSSGITGHEGGELLVRKTLELINKTHN